MGLLIGMGKSGYSNEQIAALEKKAAAGKLTDKEQKEFERLKAEQKANLLKFELNPRANEGAGDTGFVVQTGKKPTEFSFDEVGKALEETNAKCQDKAGSEKDDCLKEETQQQLMRNRGEKFFKAQPDKEEPQCSPNLDSPPPFDGISESFDMPSKLVRGSDAEIVERFRKLDEKDPYIAPQTPSKKDEQYRKEMLKRTEQLWKEVPKGDGKIQLKELEPPIEERNRRTFLKLDK